MHGAAWRGTRTHHHGHARVLARDDGQSDVQALGVRGAAGNP